MFSITKLLVLLIICETTVCQNELSLTNERDNLEPRQSSIQNASKGDGKNSNSVTQTTNAEVDEIIPKIFTVSNSPGLVLFNNTNKPSERSIDPYDPDQDQPFNEEQDFKVQRNPDGKLHIVFNDIFFPQKSSSSAATSRRSNIQSTERTHPDQIITDDFVFPDQLLSLCQQDGKSFCTDVPHYPEKQVETQLRSKLSEFNILFGDDVYSQPINISQRMSPGEDSLCKSVERIIYPKAGESKALGWMYIVNQQNYTQAVKIEECVNADKPCMFSEHFPNGYVTSCKQNFIYRQLVAINKSGDVVKDSFKLPSCCKCIFKPR